MMSADPPENRETGQPPSQSGHPHHTTGQPQPPEGHSSSSPSGVHSYQESIPRCEAKGVTRDNIPPPSIQISSPSTPVASSVITTKAAIAGDVPTVIPITTTTTTTTTSPGASAVLTSTTSIDTVVKIPSLLTTANAIADIPIGRLSQVTTATGTLSSESLTSPKDVPTTTTSLTTTSTGTSSIATTATTTQSTSTTTVTSTATSRTTVPALSHPQVPPSSSSSWISTMGAVAPIPCDTPGELLHPTVGVNGHAHPQGAGESRDVPRNPLPLPVSHSASSVRHRERLIGPVIACVAPPPLRLADAQRERQRLASGNQRLMSKPVKRKLWEVDHDKLEVELEEECNQILEEEEKRFKERWEEIGIDDNPHTPPFYHSEVIDSTKRKEVVASASLPSSSLPSPPSSSTSSNSATPSSSKSSSSSTKPSETKSPRGGRYSSRLDSQKKSERSSVDPKSPSSASATSLVSGESAKASSVASPEALGKGEGIREDSSLLSENKSVMNDRNQSTPDTPSSPLASPTSSSSPTLNLSTSSTSSSGVWSLESTPTPERLRSQQTMTPAQTITSQGSDTPTQGRAPPTAGRIAPTQETSAPTQRPTTRSCRQRRTSQRTDSGPPRKHLRM